MAWPAAMRWRHVGADLNTSGTRQAALLPRAQAAYDAMAPHLDVLVLAVGLSIVGGLLWSRRRAVVETYLWAWAVVIVAGAIVTGAYTFGPGTIFFLDLWLQTSAHRVTEVLSLAGWWIVGATVVMGSARAAALVSSTKWERERTALSGTLGGIES